MLVSSLLQDAAGVPARLREPERWSEPWNFVHHVGGGDFQQTGQKLLQMLLESGGLVPQDLVLDMGCGNGRLAGPLSRYLEPPGGYIGFDVVGRAVAGCRRRHRRLDHFQFFHADVENALYNPAGRVAADAYQFPSADAAISLAVATSLFTHLRPQPLQHYMREAARVLRWGGRLLFTAYTLDDAAREAIGAGRCPLAFAPWGEVAMVLHPQLPEGGIAYDREWLLQSVQDAGLTIARTDHGTWRTGPVEQDLIVAIKS
jgi:SAM-dependent methyltransferase